MLVFERVEGAIPPFFLQAIKADKVGLELETAGPARGMGFYLIGPDVYAHLEDLDSVSRYLKKEYKI